MKNLDSEMKIMEGANLIDGTGRPLLKDATVVVKGSKIVHVGTKRSIDVSKGEVIDATGMTIMPGLIDCHVHITVSGLGPVETTWRQPVTFTVIFGVRNLELLLEAGYTTVRTCGDIEHIDIALKEAVESGITRGPRLLTCGRALSTTGGHGDVYFPENKRSYPHSYGRIVDGPDEVRKAVREEIRAGADWIKFLHGGIASPENGAPGAPQLTIDEMKAGCEVAHQAGKRVCAHCLSSEAIMNSITAGVDTIEHGVGIDADSAKLMSDRGIYLMSTLSPFFAMPRASVAEYVRMGESETTARKRVEFQPEKVMQFISTAMKAGVKIAPGSDSGFRWHHHGDNALELQLLVETGFSPMEAIMAATKNASEALGLGSLVGTVEEGKLADLLIVEGNPLERISILREKKRIRTVIKGGQVVVSEGVCTKPPFVYPVREWALYPAK